MIDPRISDGLGWMSMLCWLGAQFPQVIVNIQNQSVEGLALPFLANWLFGDISNLVGCILTHQLPFQTYLATYFCLVDFSLLCQYIYYYKPTPPTSLPSSPTTPSEGTPLLVGSSLLEQGGVAPYDSTTKRFSGVIASYPPSGLLPSADEIGHTHARSRSRSRARMDATTGGMPLTRTWSHRTSTQTLRELSNAAAGVALAAARRGGTYPRPGAHSGTHRHDSAEGEEDDQVPAMMTESWISTMSAATTGAEEPYTRRRTISWDRDAARSPTHPIINVQSTEHGSAGSSTIRPEESEARRQRSRSRGRASRPRVLSLDFDNVDSPVKIPVEELAKRTDSARGSGSRGRRSASIVFLSFGAVAFLSFGGVRTSAGLQRRTIIPKSRTGEVLDHHMSFDWEQTSHRPSEPTPVYFPDYASKSDEPPERHHKERPPPDNQDRERVLGRIFAWTCTTLYLTSRLPQIWKNFTRKSVEGLSLALFVFAFLGNFFYVSSILTSPILFVSNEGYASTEDGRRFLKESLPYLLGSGGTLIFDIIIVSQGLYYTRLQKQLALEDFDDDIDSSGESDGAETPALVKDADERQPLLTSPTRGD